MSQIRASAFELMRLAKEYQTILIFIGHVTKEGLIAGPRVLEHMVDTVLYFEGEKTNDFRLLRCVKNRFGATNEVGIFDMTPEGLKAVRNPSSLFSRSAAPLQRTPEQTPGTRPGMKPRTKPRTRPIHPVHVFSSSWRVPALFC